MPLKFVSGDPLLTKCDMLAIAHNAKGRTEVDVLAMRLMREFPTAFSSYVQRCRRDKQKGGDLFFWIDTKPKLLFLTVRDSSVGATRLRHVQKCLMTIARDYKLYHMKSLALIPIGTPYEQLEIKPLYETWFSKMTLPVIVYENYQDSVQADETF
jgi:hypothetical protein